MTELVERESELAAIENIVRRGGVMLIEAGAGVGKTSLVEVASTIAQATKRIVLHARGSDLEHDFAFGIARQLFERRYAAVTAEERDALIAGPARGWLRFLSTPTSPGTGTSGTYSRPNLAAMDRCASAGVRGTAFTPGKT
jgi:hypothetical protein